MVFFFKTAGFTIVVKVTCDAMGLTVGDRDVVVIKALSSEWLATV